MRSALIAVLFLLTMAPAAGAASIAYVDGGDVWLSSLDGAQKVRLESPVVNADGLTEKWLAVAASDSGRIVAARNVPGYNSGLTWFKVWEPNGTSTVEGPLNSPSGAAIKTYPLGFDVTADGNHMVYGFSNSGFCCPIYYSRGTYVRPVTNSSLEPINVDREHPTLIGDRMIAHTGGTVFVQNASGAPYGNDFTPWISSGVTSSSAAPTSRRTGSSSQPSLSNGVTAGRRSARSRRWRSRGSISRSRPQPPWIASYRRTVSPRTPQCQWTRRASPGPTTLG